MAKTTATASKKNATEGTATKGTAAHEVRYIAPGVVDTGDRRPVSREVNEDGKPKHTEPAAFFRPGRLPDGQRVKIADLLRNPLQTGDAASRAADAALIRSIASGVDPVQPRIVVSRDGYILQGHRRADALRFLYENAPREWVDAVMPGGEYPVHVLDADHNSPEAVSAFFDFTRADGRKAHSPGFAFLGAVKLWERAGAYDLSNKGGSPAHWESLSAMGKEAQGKFYAILSHLTDEGRAALVQRAEANPDAFPARSALYGAYQAQIKTYRAEEAARIAGPNASEADKTAAAKIAGKREKAFSADELAPQGEATGGKKTMKDCLSLIEGKAEALAALGITPATIAAGGMECVYAVLSACLPK